MSHERDREVLIKRLDDASRVPGCLTLDGTADLFREAADALRGRPRPSFPAKVRAAVGLALVGEEIDGSGRAATKAADAATGAVVEETKDDDFLMALRKVLCHMACGESAKCHTPESPYPCVAATRPEAWGRYAATVAQFLEAWFTQETRSDG
jgi:hypothetical protein